MGMRLSRIPIVFGSFYNETMKHSSLRRSYGLSRHNTLHGLIFISPWLIGFLIFTLYPLLASLYFSFTNYDVLSQARWIGFNNYKNLFANDPLFITALRNTLYYMAVSIPASMLLATSLAILLNTDYRGISVFRLAVYIPSTIAPVAASVIWLWILNPNYGLANEILGFLGLSRIGWLSSPTWSKPSLILINLWTIGPTVIIYLASLQGIPRNLYEAAILDGANAWHRFYYITLPMLTPAFLFSLITGIIDALQYFTQAYVLTDGSGRPLDSTLFYALLLYRNAFAYLKMGYASAMAWLLFILALGLTVLLLRSSNRWVYYRGKI